MQTEKKRTWNAANYFAIAFAFIVLIGAGMKTEAAKAVPQKVTGIKQVDAGTGSVDITWNPLMGADSYRKYEVQYALAANGPYYFASGDGEEHTSYTTGAKEYINNLLPGKTYYVRVRAYTTEGFFDKVYYDGAWSDPFKVVTAPDGAPKSMKQTAAAETSLTMQWSSVSGATGYYIEYQGSKSSNKKAVWTRSTSKKFTGLSKNEKYEFKIYAYRQDGSYKAVSGDYKYELWYPTLPTKVTGIECTAFYAYSNSAYFECSKRNGADGYQYQVESYNGKKLLTGKKTSEYIYVNSSKLKGYKFLRIKIRAYINGVSGKTKYGKWSSYVYFARQPRVESHRSSSGIKISWDKVSGAKNYSVYISTKKYSGYKKVTTTTKTGTTIKKYGSAKLKRGRIYYIYVVANRKVGSKTYRSQKNSYWSKTY